MSRAHGGTVSPDDDSDVDVRSDGKESTPDSDLDEAAVLSVSPTFSELVRPLSAPDSSGLPPVPPRTARDGGLYISDSPPGSDAGMGSESPVGSDAALSNCRVNSDVMGGSQDWRRRAGNVAGRSVSAVSGGISQSSRSRQAPSPTSLVEVGSHCPLSGHSTPPFSVEEFRSPTTGHSHATPTSMAGFAPSGRAASELPSAAELLDDADQFDPFEPSMATISADPSRCGTERTGASRPARSRTVFSVASSDAGDIRPSSDAGWTNTVTPSMPGGSGAPSERSRRVVSENIAQSRPMEESVKMCSEGPALAATRELRLTPAISTEEARDAASSPRRDDEGPRRQSPTQRPTPSADLGAVKDVADTPSWLDEDGDVPPFPVTAQSPGKRSRPKETPLECVAASKRARLDESDEALELDPVALSPVLMPDAQDDDHMVTDTPVADGAGNTMCAGNPPSARSARSARSVRSVRSAHSGDASGHSEEETVAAKVAESVPQGGPSRNFVGMSQEVEGSNGAEVANVGKFDDEWWNSMKTSEGWDRLPSASGEGPSVSINTDNPTPGDSATPAAQEDAEAPVEDDEDDWAKTWGKKEGVDWEPLDGELKEKPEDCTLLYTPILPDEKWISWNPNSQETLASTVLVQKIRGRAGHRHATPFPSEEATKEFHRLLQMKPVDQHMLIAALIWIEVNVLEVAVVPESLSEAVCFLLQREQSTLQNLLTRINPRTLRTRASCAVPPLETRKASQERIDTLIDAIHDLVPGVGEREDLAGIVEEVLGHVPVSVRLLVLAHTFEFAKLKSGQYKDQESMAVAFAKLCLPEKAIEMVCRLSLEQAIKHVNDIVGVDEETAKAAAEYRNAKAATLNRLYKDWELNPAEEQLAQLHMMSLQRQLQILLMVERDIEKFWHRMAGQVASEEERSRRMRAYTDVSRLLKPYLREEDMNASKIEDEGGVSVTTYELGKIKKSIDEVLKKLLQRYGWKAEHRTRRVMLRSNWPARLAALLELAKRPECLHADDELRRLVKRESHQRHGAQVLVAYNAWSKLEAGEGMVVKMLKVMDESALSENRKLYSGYAPDTNRQIGPDGFLPVTPTFSGMATPGMHRGTGTPGMPFMPGTPAGPPPGTPGPLFRLAGTPAGPPPGTPGLFRLAGTPAGAPPGTPGMFRPAPGTPADAMPGTPGYAVVNAAGPSNVPATPREAFVAPGTPAMVRNTIPSTPFGSAAQRVPSTPREAFIGSGGGNVIPSTPRDAFLAGSVPINAAAAAANRVPSTPREALMRVPSTPQHVLPAGKGGSAVHIPSTPSGSIIPSTPVKGAADQKHLHGAPAPFTPAMGPAPFTPGLGPAAPFTPAIGQALPFTPRVPSSQAGAPAPFTPMRPVPSTPAITGH